VTQEDGDGLYWCNESGTIEEILEIRGGLANTIACSQTGILAFKNFDVWNAGLFLKPVEIKDLPLYVSWPVLYPRFEELLKNV